MALPVGMVVPREEWRPFRSQRARFSTTAATLRSWWRDRKDPGGGPAAGEGGPEGAEPGEAAGEAGDLAPQAALGPLPDGVALDVGFAALSIGAGSEGRPSLLSIEARDGAVTEEGTGALLQMMDNVLSLDDVWNNFLFICDLRSLTWPQPDMLVSIRHWGCEPERQEKWRKCCQSWTIVVPDGVYYYGARLAMGNFFFSNPPMCCTYLVTDPLEVGQEDVVQFDPEGPLQGEPSLWAALVTLLEDAEGDGREPQKGPGEGQPAPVPGDGAPPAAAAGEADNVAARDASGADKEGTSGDRSSAAADSVDEGFIVARQSFLPERGRADLLLIGRAGSATVEGLDRLLVFMDGFSRRCEKEELHFTTTYDFRQMSIPPISMVKKLAEWGNEPERMERWHRLNNACKVVVGSGFVFVLSKSLLNTYFYACPPVCRTYILTDPDDPEDGAFFFDPAPKNASGEGEDDGVLPAAEAPNASEAPSEPHGEESLVQVGEEEKGAGEASPYLEPDDECRADVALRARTNLLKTRIMQGPGLGGVR